ncbi:MAG: hypothetical protein EOP51_01260 [Sphingobacteriales bacterium]|nr:MAG: hypothetical protein EOP51_01260 [Sphingobacteriales bacterium]
MEFPLSLTDNQAYVLKYIGSLLLILFFVTRYQRRKQSVAIVNNTDERLYDSDDIVDKRLVVDNKLLKYYVAGKSNMVRIYYEGRSYPVTGSSPGVYVYTDAIKDRITPALEAILQDAQGDIAGYIQGDAQME